MFDNPMRFVDPDGMEGESHPGNPKDKKEKEKDQKTKTEKEKKEEKKEKWKFEVKAQGEITSNHLAVEAKVLGAKFGGQIQGGTVVAKSEAGWNTEKGFFPKGADEIIDGGEVKKGGSAGFLFGIAGYREENRKGETLSESTEFNLGLFSLEINEVPKEDGITESTTSLKFAIGGTVALGMGASGSVEASLSSTTEIKSYTIDQMLAKGWTVPTEAINFNNYMKEFAKTFQNP